MVSGFGSRPLLATPYNSREVVHNRAENIPASKTRKNFPDIGNFQTVSQERERGEERDGMHTHLAPIPWP